MSRIRKVREHNRHTLKPCAVQGCGQWVLTGGKPRICGRCVARGVRRASDARWLESDAEIERRFQAALVEIKRTPREFLLAWPSSLPRW